MQTVYYPLNQLNADSQVHAKVNKIPGNSLFHVLFLFQNKHGVIEKLLQFLIGEVDAQLLQGVELWVEISLAQTLVIVTRK